MLKPHYDKSEVKTKKQLFSVLDEINRQAGIKSVTTMRVGDVLWVNRKSIYAFIRLKQKIRVVYFTRDKETDIIKICLGEHYTVFGAGGKHVGKKGIEKMKRWIKEWAEKNGVEFMEVD